MKKKFVLTVIAVLVLAISLTAVLAACGNGDKPSQEQQEQQEQRQQNIFALAAVSAGELIGGDGVAAAALAAGDTNAIAAELDEYMAMLDKIIGGEHPITSTVADNTSEEYSQYKIVQTVTAASPDGSSETGSPSRRRRKASICAREDEAFLPWRNIRLAQVNASTARSNSVIFKFLAVFCRYSCCSSSQAAGEKASSRDNVAATFAAGPDACSITRFFKPLKSVHPA